MPIELKFNLEGEVQLAQRIRTLDNSVNNWKPEFEQSGVFLKNFFGNEVFETRGRAIREPWKPTKNPWPILEKTGTMRRSFQSKGEAKKAEVWNATDYFKYHQSRMPRKHLPRRIMMKLNEQLINRVIKIFHEGINKRIRESK
jgi:phage gpG-like protein